MKRSSKVCNIDYDNELNLRMSDRLFPSMSLKPNLSPIPMSTKYQKFPISQTPVFNEGLNSFKSFSTHKDFFPGTSKGPVDYALDSVDVESRLRNQFFALQKNDQSVYIPSLRSPLYTNPPKMECGMPTQNDNLASIQNLQFNPDKCNLAPQFFNNSTRHNLKNLK